MDAKNGQPVPIALVPKHVTFVARVYHIHVPSPLGRGDKLTDTLRITNDADLIRELIPSRFKGSIGTLEYEDLTSATAVAYSQVRVPLPERLCRDSETMVLNHIFIEMSWLRHLLPFLWSLKDNCCSVETGFAFTEEFAFKRFCGQINTLADGANCTTVFTRDEVQAARERFRQVHDARLQQCAVADPEATRLHELTSANVSPALRAAFFIEAARGAIHPSIKIANYCSALETLLLPDTASEITRTLAQRIALLIGMSLADRIQICEDMQTIYSVRSKAVHGGILADDKLRKKLPPAARKADEILRRVVSSIFTPGVFADYALGKNTDLKPCTRFFLEMSLGEPRR